MFDIKFIRDNPKEFDAAMQRRGRDAQSPALLKLDEERRAVQTELQTLQQARNEKSKEVGEIKKSGGDPPSPDGSGATSVQGLMDEVAALKTQMGALEERERTVVESLNQHLAGLPNILADDVPDGADEADNVEVRTFSPPNPPACGGEAKRSGAGGEWPEHYDIGEALGMMDFETAAKLSGSRFVLLHSGLARMERALAQFMLDLHTSEHGYTEVSPPLLVRDHVLYGTGQLPKFEEDLYKAMVVLPKEKRQEIIDLELCKIKQEGDELRDTLEKVYEIIQDLDNHWLIPTAEVPLTNIVADSIIEDDYLPRRYTAFTPCFRSEAGAAGKDTRGMLRQHQFYKVEMVSVTRPEDSQDEHERMTECAETVLKKLDLPFRTVVLCSGDTGFGATKTYDIEVWLPGQDTYREISSCSNCGDFQARRMKARMRRAGNPSSPDGLRRAKKDTEFVHTLNGSGVAVGRALIAVMENYYDPSDGSVAVPDVLKPYMGGQTKIEPKT